MSEKNCRLRKQESFGQPRSHMSKFGIVREDPRGFREKEGLGWKQRLDSLPKGRLHSPYRAYQHSPGFASL